MLCCPKAQNPLSALFLVLQYQHKDLPLCCILLLLKAAPDPWPDPLDLFATIPPVPSALWSLHCPTPLRHSVTLQGLGTVPQAAPTQPAWLSSGVDPRFFPSPPHGSSFPFRCPLTPPSPPGEHKALTATPESRPAHRPNGFPRGWGRGKGESG